MSGHVRTPRLERGRSGEVARAGRLVRGDDLRHERSRRLGAPDVARWLVRTARWPSYTRSDSIGIALWNGGKYGLKLTFAVTWIALWIALAAIGHTCWTLYELGRGLRRILSGRHDPPARRAALTA